jgi:hypothetical protein
MHHPVPHGPRGHFSPIVCPPTSLSLAEPHSLVFDLEVEVPTEPVIEEGLLHIAGGCQLWRGPDERSG